MLKYLIDNDNRLKKEDMAAFGQKYLADGISTIAIEVAKSEHIRTIAISGGVLVNRYISRQIIKKIQDNGLNMLINHLTPLGDGGSSVGQNCIALASVI